MQKSIKEAFGLSFDIIQTQAPKGLPFYMSNNRKFYELKSDAITFLVVELSDIDKFGVVALEKQLAKYMEITKMNAAYAFSKLNKVQRDALTGRMIPFVCLPSQIYLPFLGIVLANQFKKEKVILTDRMTPAAQSLFLYFLYCVKDKAVLKKDAADALGLTRTSITRASEQLKALGLINEEAHGKEVRMSASEVGRAYFEQARPYLINPVCQVITVAGNEALQDLPLSGESALSNRSMLNSPRLPIVAVAKNDPMVKKFVITDEKWESSTDLYQVELWKYNPGLFIKDHLVDPVSMLLILQNCQDERVQGELEDYLEELEW